MHALDEMVPKSGRESGPGLDLRHSLTKNEAPHLISQMLHLIGICRGAKAFRQREKSFLFFFLRFETLFDQFYQDTIIAEAPSLGDTLHLFRQPRGQGNAPSNLFGGCHDTIVHRYGALRW